MNSIKKKIPENLESDQEAQEKIKQALPKIFQHNKDQDSVDYLLSDEDYKLILAKATGVGNFRLQGALIGRIEQVIRSRGKDRVAGGNEILSLLYEIAPKTALEGMLAVQMIGVHYLATEMMNRAAYKEQTIDGVDRNINRASKLTRVFTAQLEALQRLRRKGQQTVRVEHVTVNAGGQAIVGNVDHQGGGGKSEKERSTPCK